MQSLASTEVLRLAVQPLVDCKAETIKVYYHQTFSYPSFSNICCFFWSHITYVWLHSLDWELVWELTAAAEMPAVWAAMGVDFLMFLNPSVPQDVLTIDCPALSVSWMCVLPQYRTVNCLADSQLIGMLCFVE